MLTLSRRLVMLILMALLAVLVAACGNDQADPATNVQPEPEAEVAPGATGNEAEVIATTLPEGATEAPVTEATAATGGDAMEPTAATGADAAAILPTVNPQQVEGDVVIAGSSTVYPLTQRMADIFRQEGYTGEITISSIGSGAGFERFCGGETDISNASRAITEEEVQTCQQNNIEPLEFRVGTDALAVVVNQENDFVDSLTLDQLAQIYSGTAQTWADVNPAWPAEPIQLFSPGTDSGTFDYFVEEVFADTPEGEREAQILRANPQLSEDDNVLVQGVEGSPYAIGYFGYAYYNENRGSLRAVPIDGIEPNEQSAESGEYPLSRPLFIYSAPQIIEQKPQVGSFITYYLNNVSDEIIGVGYFPASVEAIETAQELLAGAL